MCQTHRTEFRCKHFREQIAPHNLGDGSFTECKDTKANITFKHDNNHDCPRCNNKRAVSSSTRACVNNVNAITAGLSDMQVVPAPAPRRPSALYAEKVKQVVAAKLARKRAMQAAAAAAGGASPAKQPVQAGTPPISRVPAATRGGAPVGTTNARAAGERSARGAPAAATAAAAAAARVPAVRGGQVPAKVQGRVVVPGSSRG